MKVKKLSVGILMPWLTWEGGSQAALTLSDAMQRAGHHVAIAVIQPSSQPLASRPVPVVPTKYFEASGLPMAILHTRSWTRDHNFDVLLAEGDWAAMVAGIACLGLKRGPQVIVGSENFPISAKFGDFPHFKGRILGAAMRFGYRHLSGTVCVNRDLHARMVSELGWEAERCPVIPNPLRLHPIDPAKAIETSKIRRSLGEDYVVATACALQPRKDLPTLLRAFAEASKQLPMQLRIAGTGQELEHLRNLSVSLGIESRVQFLGVVQDMPSFLRSADVFGFSSTQEALPLVIPEAMSQALPVVATDCHSGPAEMITDGVHGRLVPVGDDRALAAAIVDVLRNPLDPPTLVNRALDFAADEVAASYIDFFRRLMKYDVKV